ncbi:MAG: hypothetical protein ACK4JD_05600 [Thermoflexales bacterium]
MNEHVQDDLTRNELAEANLAEFMDSRIAPRAPEKLLDIASFKPILMIVH